MINFSKTIWLAIVLIIILCATGVFAYQWYQTKGELVKQIEESERLTKQAEELQKEIEKLKAAKEKITDETADWKTYRNEYYGFEIDYPIIEGWRFREDWPLRTYSGGGRSLFAYYGVDLVDPNVFDLVLSAQGVVGEIYFLDSECEILKWNEEFIENISFEMCNLPVKASAAMRTISMSGAIGYRGNDGRVSSAYEVGGPIGFVIFPLKIDFEDQHPVLLIYYMRYPYSEPMKNFFEQVVSTFRFIK